MPRGGTAGVEVGDDADPDVDTDGDGTGGADVTEGDPLIRSVGIADAELTGSPDDDAPVNCVPTGADSGGDCGGDCTVDCTGPAWLRWLEQPAAVTASTTERAAMAACDVVRLTFYPPPGFTLSA